MMQERISISLWTFMREAASHWVALMSGGVVTVALGVFERLSGRNVPLWTYLSVLAFFLLLSFYLAWRDSRKAMSRLQSELSNVHEELKEAKQYLLIERDQNSPNITGFTSMFVFGDSRTTDGVVVAAIYVLVTIRNQGAPSIVEGYQLHVNSKDSSVTANPVLLPEAHTITDTANGQSFTIHGDEALYEKTTVPIERGGQRRGWLLYYLPNISVKELLPPMYP